MHPDDFNKVWLCCECRRVFAFNSEVEDHKLQFKHSTMMLCDLHNDIGRPQLFTRGRLSLSFRLDGKTSRVTMDYEYYPSSGKIHYIDARYTDDKLKSMLEENPEMMKKIDNYLRRLVARELYLRPNFNLPKI